MTNEIEALKQATKLEVVYQDGALRFIGVFAGLASAESAIKTAQEVWRKVGRRVMPIEAVYWQGCKRAMTANKIQLLYPAPKANAADGHGIKAENRLS